MNGRMFTRLGNPFPASGLAAAAPPTVIEEFTGVWKLAVTSALFISISTLVMAIVATVRISTLSISPGPSAPFTVPPPPTTTAPSAPWPSAPFTAPSTTPSAPWPGLDDNVTVGSILFRSNSSPFSIAGTANSTLTPNGTLAAQTAYFQTAYVNGVLVGTGNVIYNGPGVQPGYLAVFTNSLGIIEASQLFTNSSGLYVSGLIGTELGDLKLNPAANIDVSGKLVTNIGALVSPYSCWQVTAAAYNAAGTYPFTCISNSGSNVVPGGIMSKPGAMFTFKGHLTVTLRNSGSSSTAVQVLFGTTAVTIFTMGANVNVIGAQIYIQADCMVSLAQSVRCSTASVSATAGFTTATLPVAFTVPLDSPIPTSFQIVQTGTPAGNVNAAPSYFVMQRS